MMFSEKRAGKRIKSMLVVAKNHATGLKGLDDKKLVVGKHDLYAFLGHSC